MKLIEKFKMDVNLTVVDINSCSASQNIFVSII